ncbi:uncharacterized protein TNCV_85981 [Trichonephila clavipes]|nr:uncharacterized protein TNCV_85981 [Trichonephila clavipes]
MDEILTTDRDLELEVNEDDIEELIMGHEDELTVELQEILNEVHQETQRNVSPSEQEEDERGPMPTSSIKDLLKKWEVVRAMVLECHPNQADASVPCVKPWLHGKHQCDSPVPVTFYSTWYSQLRYSERVVLPMSSEYLVFYMFS